MAIPTITYPTQWHRGPSKWRTFCAIYRTLNRQGELKRLIAWATWKRLPRPRKAYKNRLVDEERRLMRYRFNSPRLVRLARFVQWLSYLVRANPRYPAKGSAAGYRFGGA